MYDLSYIPIAKARGFTATIGNDIRKILDNNLQAKADKDKKAIQKEISEGNNREDVLNKYVNDQTFQDWYSSFTKEINAAMNN